MIGAAAEIAGHDEFIVVGSQAILGAHPEPPPELLESMEVDLYPRSDPARASDVEGSIGDGTLFHEQFGYYAHAAGPETAKAPAGWQQRLVPAPVAPRAHSKRNPIAYCLEPHDLVLSKLVRGGARDWDYAETALAGGVVEGDVLLARVDALPAAAAKKEEIRRGLVALA